MLTDEELPPVPKFKVTHWMFTGLMAWSLFFGAVGGLGILLMADYGPEKVSPNRQLKEKVVSVDDRVSALEQQTQKLNDQQADMAQKQATASPSAADTEMTRLLVGLTQLKTAYDNDTSLNDGIETLKKTVKDSDIQQSLDQLQKLVSDNFPSKEKILDDLQAIQQPRNDNLRNEKGEQPLTDWRSRASAALSQLVRVTPTKNIINDNDISHIEQAVTSNDFGLAQKFAEKLPTNPTTQLIQSEIGARYDAQNLVGKIVTQISSAIGSSQGSLY